MDAREQRGLEIAAKCRIRKVGDWFHVPSQTTRHMKYTVRAKAGKPVCNCPDHETRGVRCKHIFAVLFTLEREENDDGTTTVTERLTVTETVEKKTTCPQQWGKYNRAQSVEKDRFQELLADLCRRLPEPERKGAGRKPHSVKDSVFSMVFKVYSTFSSRRFSSDLREAFERGHISRPIPGMKTVQFFENPELTPILCNLIAESAKPLATIETTFAIDSTGFGSNRTERWFDEKHGTPKRKSVWTKVHTCCGTKTNVITAVRILDKDAADSPQFRPLLEDTAKAFTVKEMTADKAYARYANYDAVESVGGTAYIAFKETTTASRGGIFEKMFLYFLFRREEFLNHYHKRSNEVLRV